MHNPMKITMPLVKRIVIAICCVIVLSACGSWRGAEPLPSPTATRTPSPSSTPTVTATLTPTSILSVETTPEATLADPVELEMQQALRLLYVTENETCWKAARTLGRIGPVAIPALIPILKEAENEEVRGAAAYALGEMGAEAIPAVPALVEALEDEESLVRTITAEALGKIGPGAVEAVPALVKAMAVGPGGDLRAAYALGGIGPRAIEAVPALIETLERRLSQDMDTAVYYALVQITAQDFGYYAAAWRQWWEASGCLTDCQTPDQAAPSPSATSTPEIAYPFGSLVIALQDETVWLLTENEAPQLLAYGFSPQISPDGHWVVGVHHREEYSTIPLFVLIDTHNRTEKLLFSPEDRKTCYIYGRAWSPDSSHIAFTCGGDAKRMYFGDLLLVDLVDGTVTQIAERDAGIPHFSPDGQWIATSTPWEGWTHGSIALWHIEGKRNQALFSPLYQLYLEWADDSSGLAAAFQKQTEGLGLSEGLELWWIPVDATPVRLGYLPGAFRAIWQPNTERLVYTGPSYNSGSVHLVNHDGSGDTVIPGSEGMSFPEDPPWSPDGHWLLLVDYNRLPYIVDTNVLHTPISLNVDRVHGWVDATHYLASTYREDVSELYLCTLPETCRLLAQFAGQIRSLGYTEQVYQP